MSALKVGTKVVITAERIEEHDAEGRLEVLALRGDRGTVLAHYTNGPCGPTVLIERTGQVTDVALNELCVVPG